MSAAVDEAYAAPDKSTQSMLIDAAYLKVSEELGEEAKGPLKTLFSRKMYEMASLHSKRVDGRAIEQIRPIDIQMDVLPRVHGSAVFTRGETQSFATATLGDKGMQLKVDTVDGAQTKKFYLQVRKASKRRSQDEEDEAEESEPCPNSAFAVAHFWPRLFSPPPLCVHTYVANALFARAVYFPAELCGGDGTHRLAGKERDRAW